MHHELVLVDQSQLRQGKRELRTCDEQPPARLPLELLNGLSQIPAQELRVPIDPVEGARDDVFLHPVDRPGEGLHPIGPRSRPRRRPPRGFHHLVRHPAKEEGVGLGEVLDRVSMQLFVGGHCTMIDAPTQCDVDGIPKALHGVAGTADEGGWQTAIPTGRSSPLLEQQPTRTAMMVAGMARRRRLKSISVPITLGAVTVSLAAALLVGWSILVGQRIATSEAIGGPVSLLVLGAVSFVVIMTVLVLLSVYLAREILEVRRQNSFVDSVTHELKSPLASLKLFLETLGRPEIADPQ